MALVFAALSASASFSQEATASTAMARASTMLAALAGGEKPILFGATFKHLTDAEYPILGLAGYSTQDGHGEAMMFQPCDGDLREVKITQLADTNEKCPEVPSDKPTIVLVGSFSVKIGYFSQDSSGLNFQEASASISDIKESWTAGDFDFWLDKTVSADAKYSPTPEIMKSADSFVVEEYKLGDQSVLAVRLPPEDMGAVQWWQGGQVPP